MNKHNSKSDILLLSSAVVKSSHFTINSYKSEDSTEEFVRFVPDLYK